MQEANNQQHPARQEAIALYRETFGGMLAQQQTRFPVPAWRGFGHVLSFHV